MSAIIPGSDSLILKSLAAPISGITGTPVTVLQAFLPANFWQVNAEIELWMAMAKSGATDALRVAVYLGTLGTSGDTAITPSANVLGATALSGGYILPYKLLTATSVQRGGAGAPAAAGYTGSSTVAAPAAVAVTSLVTTGQFLTVQFSSSGATDTVSIQGARLIYRPNTP